MARKKKTSGEGGLRFRLESKPLARQRELLECFSRELERALGWGREPGEPLRDVGRKGIMDAVGKQTGYKLDVRQFDSFLKHLYDDGHLRIRHYRLPQQAGKLHERKKLELREGITVVAGSDPDYFAQAAAEDFIRRMFEIGSRKKAEQGGDKAWLNVGIVSGNTTGKVVRAAARLDWRKEFALWASDLPRVRVFALNVCLTVRKHLDGNATILAHLFAKKIEEQAGQEDKAEAYGLSAPLMVERRRLPEVDGAPQTRDVLEFTEPNRVRDRRGGGDASARSAEEVDTQLDIVLTGVGELPGQDGEDASGKQSTSGRRGSIFYNLAKQFKFDMDRMVKAERIVGDIAFTAIRSDGKPVFLSARYRTEGGGPGGPAEMSKADGDAEYVVYSAVELPILKAMATDPNKSVILVARYEKGKSKVPAIFASVAGERYRYASRLIIDEETANELLRY